MKNKSIDLNNHLFAQLERLSDENIKGEELEEELKRADMISKVSAQIINNASLTLRAEQIRQVHGEKPKMEFLDEKQEKQ